RVQEDRTTEEQETHVGVEAAMLVDEDVNGLGMAQLYLQLLRERVDAGIVHVGDADRVADHPGEEHACTEPKPAQQDQHVNKDYSKREEDDRKKDRHQQ